MNRPVRAIDAEALKRAIHEEIEGADSPSTDPLGRDAFKSGLHAARRIVDAAPTLSTVGRGPDLEMYLTRIRFALAAGHTAAYDLRADISAILDEARDAILAAAGEEAKFEAAMDEFAANTTPGGTWIDRDEEADR